MISLRKPSHALVLDPAALDRFLAVCSQERFPNKADVFRPGDAGGRLIYVVSGRLNIVAQGEDGAELILGTVGPGDFVGEASLFIPVSKRNVALRTVEASHIASIDCAHLLELMQGALAQDAAKLLYALGMQLSRRLMETSRKASGLALLDVAARVWLALDDLTKAPGAMTHPKGMQVKTSRQDLAKTVGCSREMAGRVIKQFVKEGRMEARGKTMVIFSEPVVRR